VTELRAIVDAEHDSVSELRKLVGEAQQTTAHAADSAEAAQRTVEIVAAAQKADQRHRQLDQLRAIGRLLTVIQTSAAEEMYRPPQSTNQKRWSTGNSRPSGRPWCRLVAPRCCG
jgi:hypothetical protein